MGPVERVLKDAKVGKGDVDEVVLVGGSTRIPKVQELIKQFFNVSARKASPEIVLISVVAHIACLFLLSIGQRAEQID